MKIKLDEPHTLYSDAYCFWIAVEVTPKKPGAKAYEKIVSGYHPTAAGALGSYSTRSFRASEAKSVKALEKEVQELIKEVRLWEPRLNK